MDVLASKNGNVKYCKLAGVTTEHESCLMFQTIYNHRATIGSHPSPILYTYSGRIRTRGISILKPRVHWFNCPRSPNTTEMALSVPSPGRLKPKGAAGGACFILSCDCSAGITISGQVASRFTFDHQHPSFCSPHHWWCSYFFLLRNFFFFFSLYKLLFSLLLLLDNSQSLKIWFIILT